MFPQIKDEMGVKNKWQKFCRRWRVLQAGLWCAVHRVWRKARGRKGAGEGGGGGGGEVEGLPVTPLCPAVGRHVTRQSHQQNFNSANIDYYLFTFLVGAQLYLSHALLA